jgi:hypothetical protein
MFIKIGEGRIKRSNIKNYGVGKEERTRENSLMDRIDNMEYEDGVLNKVSAFLEDKKRYFVKYLYITTYQNDNFKFYESEVDIDAIIKQLDGT